MGTMWTMLEDYQYEGHRRRSNVKSPIRTSDYFAFVGLTMELKHNNNTCPCEACNRIREYRKWEKDRDAGLYGKKK